jgi:cobalt/nickel transport system permease protein
VFVFFATGVGFLPHTSGLLAASGIGWLALLAARIPASWYAPRAMAALGFLLFLVLPMPWMTVPQPDEPTWWGASWSGTNAALKVVCRAWTTLALGWTCLLGLSAADWRAVCADLRLGSSVAMMVWMSGRCLNVLSGEWRQMRLAARMRGARLAANRQSWKIIGLLVGMGLIRSSVRAERMGVALSLRSGNSAGIIPRRIWNRTDLMVAATALGVGILMIWVSHSTTELLP